MENIVNWYKFKENSTVLEVKDGLDLSGVQEKYDYIIFYDLNEVDKIKPILKDSGTALLIVNNKFAIANFAGNKPENVDIYDTITKNDKKTFSKRGIESKLNKLNLNSRFYYVLPNLENPNVIFSDRYLPEENTSKLMYNISYLPGSMVVFDELNALKQITKEGYFEDFANSYIVEIGNLEEDEPKFVSYNTSRKSEYQLMTAIYDDKVEKIAMSEESQKHINQIWENTENLRKFGFDLIEKKENDFILSRFVKSETLDKIIAKLMIEGKVDNAISQIKNWYGYINDKLPHSVQEDELNWTDYGYIDLVFENVFLEENKFLFFDQEWFIGKTPMEFILYRAIKNLYAYNREINDIFEYNKMLDLFSLTRFQDKFNEIEKDFQDKVIDSDKVAKNSESLNCLVDLNKVRLLDDYIENSRKQDKYIKELEAENQRKQEYISVLERNQRKFFRRK